MIKNDDGDNDKNDGDEIKIYTAKEMYAFLTLELYLTHNQKHYRLKKILSACRKHFTTYCVAEDVVA